MHCVASLLLRLIATISLMLMPLGVANAVAPVDSAPEATQMSHCDEDRGPAQPLPGADRNCAACVALPAHDAPMAASDPAPQAPQFIERAQFRIGRGSEVATPPPKSS